MTTEYQIYKTRMRAEIAGVDVPVVSAAISWTLNGIPECTLRLPVGRDSATMKPSPVHNLVKRLRVTQPMKVWFELLDGGRSGGGDQMDMPEGEVLLFDGFTAGCSFTKDKGKQGSAQFVVSGLHWLVQLTYGTIFSQQGHPGNPANYSFGMRTATACSGQTSQWSSLTEASCFATTENCRQDLWGKALLPWLTYLSSEDSLWIAERNIKGEGTNTAFAAALERMGPTGRCYNPLKISNAGLDNNLAMSIAIAISTMSRATSALAQQTVWSLLIQRLAPDFMFSVVPRVDDALIVPYVPGLRETHKRIGADTYDVINPTHHTPHPLRAIGVLASHLYRSGVPAGQGNAPGMSGVAGFYDTEQDGAVMIVPAPSWLAYQPAPHLQTDANAPVATAVMVESGITAQAIPDDKAVAEARKSFIDRYAQFLYVSESLKSRQCRLSGALRFDIAPGSSVEIEGSGERFIAADALGAPIFGTVVRTTVTIDAAAESAATGFHVAYTRNEAENESDDSSVGRHPLYDNAFTGCSLL